jgi:SAM-dependent methyltransferase
MGEVSITTGPFGKAGPRADHAHADLVCPECHAPLLRRGEALDCTRCGEEFPAKGGIADFARGAYYDQFEGDEGALTERQACGLCNEEAGARARIEDFYLPLIRRMDVTSASGEVRVLDSGCGNGRSVELLRESGIDAWGNDLSALRKWQWRDHPHRGRLVVADTARLPFPDGFFHVALSSGVLEHIGVDEIGGETYSVTPRLERHELRRAFLQELLRVVRPGGVLYLDFPNGTFPIDFWHGTVPGGARWHSLPEGFLPKVQEIRSYLRRIGDFEITALSPRMRLRMRQVGQHWWGRLLRLPMVSLLHLMEVPGFRWMSASGLNPYLVLRVEATTSPVKRSQACHQDVSG